MIRLEIVGFAKDGGPLTKRISLSPDGKVVSNGAACVMSHGKACRVRLDDLESFAALIAALERNEAIALGALDADLPDQVEVVTKRKLSELNGHAINIIARTADHIRYAPDKPALALIDIDTKGMPAEVVERINAAKGYWAALLSVLPGLANAARVTRASTSTGLYRTDTRERVKGSGGFHIYLPITDGGDTQRFLKTFHDRCWLHGLGWYMIGAGGQLLERSLIDRTVFAAERLVFEATPNVVPPLAQDQASRAPVVDHGAVLDTKAVCLPLNITEQDHLNRLRSQAADAIKPSADKARAAFTKARAEQILKRSGGTLRAVLRVARRWCEGILTPLVVLPFDSDEFAGCTVGDVLADPERFAGATLADPLEGVEYGICKAKVMRRSDGSPWIHSFAHGRTCYELRHDARSVEEAIGAAPKNEVADTFVEHVLTAELEADEQQRLMDLACKRSGIGKRSMASKLKAAHEEQEKQRAREERTKRAAGRLDPRPQIPAPLRDAPWLPAMSVLNDVLSASAAPEPPMRDIDGVIAQVRVRRVPNMHALTQAGSNEEELKETRLPPPEQPLLSRLSEPQLAELIERHIDYIDEGGRSVHLAAPFVKHFHTRTDDALPTVAAIATLPIVLPDGTLLAKRGLDRDRGIVFRVPDELLKLMPKPEDCTPAAVVDAMQFLTNEWLADVSTDFAGKCILISAALTVIERVLLPERPTFFVTAGRRGGGKTTTLIMLLMAVTGVRPSAAAWSSNEEERRKALLAYLMEALPAIVWDNIVRGTQISCPHIEKSCTSAFYSDRRLGVSEMVAVAASAIHFFTGNNIGPRGDLASRSLQVRLEVDRADPENRDFKHPDPIGWTEANRGRLLRALYTILLGNPALGSNAVPQTRFKAWWRLVGSAVENAAEALHAEYKKAFVDDTNDPRQPQKINFRDLFLSQEEDDEETANLADALAALNATKWPQEKGPEKIGQFQASDVARMVNDQSEFTPEEQRQRNAMVREFLFPTLPSGQIVTPKSTSKRLKRHVGEPVKSGERTLCLKETPDTHSKSLRFFVNVT